MSIIFEIMFVFLIEYVIMKKNNKNGENMKLRRSDRMVVISNYLLNHPYELTSLNTLLKSMNQLNPLFQKILSSSNALLKRSRLDLLKQLLVREEESSLLLLFLIESPKKLLKDYEINCQKVTAFLPGGYITILIS